MKTKKRLGIPLCRQCNCYHTKECDNIFAESPFDALCQKVNNVCATIGWLVVALICLHVASYPMMGLFVWLFMPADGSFPGNTIAALIFGSAHVLTALLYYCFTQRKKWFPSFFGKAHF